MVNKTNVDKKRFKLDDHTSYKEKTYNEMKLLSSKQSEEELLVESAVKSTIQELHGRGLFESCDIIKKNHRKREVDAYTVLLMGYARSPFR